VYEQLEIIRCFFSLGKNNCWETTNKYRQTSNSSDICSLCVGDQVAW